uniref:Pi-ta n=1 Tax=Oryza rufipogon TaxID=4529 RepID=A0A0E0PP04_ORYRU
MEGAMVNLPGRLDELLRRHGNILPKGADKEIPLIRQDIEEITSILHGHHSDATELEDYHDMVVRCWTKEVRELSYDIEDCIDQYEDAVEQYEHAATVGRYPSVSTIRRRKFSRRPVGSKTPLVPEKLKQRLWMANKIREFSLRVQEALQRHAILHSSDLGGIANTSAGHPTLCRKRADGVRHVGLDAAINKVQEWLADGEKKLKGVSIVGVGGVGKTTLANELYRKLGRQFECQAFVRSSQKVDMRRLLISMLSQVRLQQPPDNWKLHSLISSIRTHLQDKRYLIIIDDLWDICTWDIIKCTLPDGNSCSRILITTEIEDLALQSCGYESNYIFKMKPLSEDDSRNLFFSTVFGSHSNCPPELCEVSYDIVRKCGGLPLAVVTIASLLATQLEKHEQWDYINETLGYSLMANPNLEGMKQLLNLCYNSLPQHLKACMLYLRMYQENSIIWKDDLVNQWIAEGFICPSEGHEKEEISRAYFSELVDRKFIQPVHINDNGEVLSCVVHHMVLNLITYMSTEENFAIAIDHTQATTRLADKVRRLSIHFGNVEDATPPTNMRLSQVRTLAFCGVLNCMPSITGFQLLKVLILHFCGDEDSISFDLTEILELVRLRYLKVTSNITLKMPTHMQGLQYLEALKIDGKIDAVPSDIVHLPGLLHLSLPARTNPPNGIAHMSSLRTLGYIDLSCNTSENLWSLGELTNLQDLQLTYSAIHSDNLKNNMQYLGSILGKLPNLKSITLSPVGSSYANTLHIHSATSTSVSVYGWRSVSSTPALLQRLELLPCVCIFSSLPNWIGQLGNLCILMIGIREVTSYDVDVLGGLPALTVLSLYVHTKPAESIVFDNARFSVLKYLKFRCSLAWMKFEAGAMPNLRKLKLGFDVHRADQHDAIPVGIENLSGLEEITAKIKVDCTAGDLCRRFAESALTDAIRMHPGRPIVNIRCVDWTFDDKDNNNVRTRDEEHRTTEKQHLIVKEGLNEKSVVLQKDHGEGACKSVEGERRGVLSAGSWWRRQPQFERFYKSAESRADDGGGGGSIISGAQTVPIKNFTGGWPAPPWQEGSGTTMPPVYINEGEYINVIYYSPPRSSTTTSSQDESTEASERERSGSGTGSSEGGFYGPTFQAVSRYIDRKFGLDRED